jgi:OOP family OmpA-OmpF porin
MKKFLIIGMGLFLFGMSNTFAKEVSTESEIGINMGATSVYNKTTIEFSSFSTGLTYQFNNVTGFGLKARLDFDYVKVVDYSNINALFKGSINGVYEFAEDNVVSPYILGGFGYEYVDGAIDRVFEDKSFAQIGAGLKYHQESGYNFYVEGKILQIIDGIRQENEVILLAGVTAPISKFKRKIEEENDCPIKIDGPDEDRDGVTDMVDQCPNTPCYFVVDQYGCPIKATLRIHFDVDKWVIKPESMHKVERFAQYLIGNKGTTVKVTGHTDSDGSDAYNITLSNNRAHAVVQQLIEFGVSAGRLSEDGRGKREPVANNSTPAGKALNRRIEVKLTYPTTVAQQ